MKKLIVFACVDFMGDVKEEYIEIEEGIRESFPNHEIEFHADENANLLPPNLKDQKYNVYVFDWGGLLPGADDLTRSIYKALLGQVQKYPQRLFIMWSTFTGDWYKEICESEFPEFIAPNVIFRQAEDLKERCRKFWFDD